MNTALPLHAMIQGVLASAKEKLASAEPFKKEEKKVNNLLKFEKQEHGHIPSVKEEKDEYGTEKDANLTDPDYVEKLASAIDFIAANVDGIEPPGPVAQALAKVAKESGSPVGAGKGPGALELNKATPGTQSYKKDKPKTEDAAASQAGSPMSDGDNGTGKTQMENNMHAAPGQKSGEKPTAKYPAKGPLVNNTKTAGFGSAVGKAAVGFSNAANAVGKKHPALLGAAGGGAGGFALGVHSGEKLERSKHTEKTASPSDVIKAAVLAKLAGEDVSKANISAKGNSNPLAGKGQLQSFEAGQAPPKAAGGPTSSFGNQARSHIAGNKAAIDYTKKDAKGPVKEQLKTVLDEPALSPKTDSTLQQNLRNTGKAGVKIAAIRQHFAKIAEAGCTCGEKGECEFCHLKEAAGKAKTAGMMGMGGGMESSAMGAGGGTAGAGMAPMASTGVGADGCSCGDAGECRVCQLKAELAQAIAESTGGGAQGGSPAVAGGIPVPGGNGAVQGSMGM